jgi:hypothetical protein
MICTIDEGTIKGSPFANFNVPFHFFNSDANIGEKISEMEKFIFLLWNSFIIVLFIFLPLN